LSAESAVYSGKNPLLQWIQKARSAQTTPQQKRETRNHEPEIDSATFQHEIDDCGKKQREKGDAFHFMIPISLPAVTV
jgi:hypothetical protein